MTILKTSDKILVGSIAITFTALAVLGFLLILLFPATGTIEIRDVVG